MDKEYRSSMQPEWPFLCLLYNLLCERKTVAELQTLSNQPKVTATWK